MPRIIEAGDDVIFLGKKGEEGAAEVRFPVAGWIKEFGHGVFQILHLRNGETTPYPVLCAVVGDEYVSWTVSSADVLYPGYGKAELTYYVGGKIAKTQTWRTFAADALAPDETPPDPYQTWLDRALAAVGEAASEVETTAKEQAEIAEGHASDAKVSAETSEHYYELAVQAAEGKGYIWFDIGSDGCLYMTRSKNLIDAVSARINDAGELEIIIL